METYTLTTIRSDIYDIADRVIKTGKPIKIKRRGAYIILTPLKNKNRLENLTSTKKAIVGDPDMLTNLSVWNEKKWRKQT